MKVIRGAVDEMWSIMGQMTSAVFRHGLPLTDKIAARTALTNFVLHIHPVRVRRSWIRMSYTLCLGGLSFFLFIVLTVTGLLLMLITLLLSFTGYLLPWDQLSIWAVTVGTNMAKYAPIAGPYTRYLMLGGHAVGDATLLRFYVMHVVGLPLVGFLLMVVHFWRVRKDGFSGGL